MKRMYVIAALIILVGILMVAYSVIVRDSGSSFTSDPTLPAQPPQIKQPASTPPKPQ